MKFKQFMIVACVLTTAVAHAQQLSFGVKGGVIPMEPTEFMNDESRRYTVGPAFEMRWGRVAVEVNLLYKRHGSSSNIETLLPGRNLLPDQNFSFTQSRRTRSHTWELPVIGKYYFRRESRLQPFVGTGYAFRKSRLHAEGTWINVVGGVVTPTQFDQNYWTELNVGAVVAGGIQWKKGRFAFTPEFRYTRWNRQPDTSIKRDQTEVLFGITF